ncbi:TPA: hypothetical protein ACJGLR_004252, partial [Salmonella enterica subsp. enterica serovar Java]
MLDTESRVACLQGKKMPAIISLIYLMFSLLVFTKKITISNVLSAFLLFLSLY